MAKEREKREGRKRAQEALRESEEKYRRLVEDSIDGIAIVEGLEIKFVNRALLKMFGCQSEEEMVGHTFTDFVSPEYRNLMAERGRARETGEDVPTRYEFKALRKDGSEFDAELSVSRISYQGRVARQGIVRDITERKRAEEALRESYESYRELADSIADVFFAMDKHLRYTYWNKASEELTGISAKDAIGKSLYDLFPDTPETRKAAKVYQDVLRTQRPQTFINEYQIEGKDFVFEISAYPSWEGLSVFVKDITERKRAEKALRDSEERHRTIFEQAAESIVLVDAETGELVEFNDAAYESLGYTREEFTKLKIADFEVIESAEDVAKHIEEIIREGSDVFETKHRTKTGQIRNILVSSRSISIGGREFVQSIWRDITERKRAEEEIGRLAKFPSENPNPVLRVAKGGTILYANKAGQPAFVECLGVPSRPTSA